MSATNTMLAFLLALKDLEDPLTFDEQSTLGEIGQRLDKIPFDWNSIEADLMIFLADNPSLNYMYKIAKKQLDAVDIQVPLDLLPTEIEIEQQLPNCRHIASFGYFKGEAELVSDEILSLTIAVLKSENSLVTTKKLSFIERLRDLLKL